MRVGIIGGSGMLGQDLLKVFLYSTNITHEECPVEYISETACLPFDGYDMIINTAAFHDMAECEKYPNKAFQVNYIGALNLARHCRYWKVRLVHISTNMVFDGLKWTPYEPTDHCAPKNIYGYSKWLGECAIRDEMEHGLDAMIVRLGPIYGHAPCRGKGGRQFVSDLLGKTGPLSYPIDQKVNPISTKDAATAIRDLAQRSAPVAHVGSSNACSWYEFARHILLKNNRLQNVEPILTRDGRPLNGVLQPSTPTPTWQESLEGYFTSRPEGA